MFYFQIQDASSKGLYKSIIQFFETYAILYKQNMVRFAADGASVMFGDKNFVFSKLKKDIPHLFTMKYVYHSLALAVTYASKVLLDSLQTLLTNIYRYLKYSTKRQNSLKKF